MEPMVARVALIAVALTNALTNAAVAAGSADTQPSLSLPIACEVGNGCLIQNYVDQDPGPNARDYRCGGQSYHGHKGTDFRVRNESELAGRIRVVAAADGIVKAVRDGVADRSGLDTKAHAGRECGNGVLLKHDGGWETQYCHLRADSLFVHIGDHVSRGATLGFVGLSGLTEFPHLHFEIRKHGTVIDPFTGSATKSANSAECASSQQGLWDATAGAALAYRLAAVLEAGFSDGEIDLRTVERTNAPEPSPSSSALVAYVRVLGVRQDDAEIWTINDPNGVALVERGPIKIAKSKAQWFSFVGRRKSVKPWPSGRYEARYLLLRQGKTLIEHRFHVTF